MSQARPWAARCFPLKSGPCQADSVVKVGDIVLCLHLNAASGKFKFKLRIHVLMQNIHQVLGYLSSVFNDV